MTTTPTPETLSNWRFMANHTLGTDEPIALTPSYNDLQIALRAATTACEALIAERDYHRAHNEDHEVTTARAEAERDQALAQLNVAVEALKHIDNRGVGGDCIYTVVEAALAKIKEMK